MDSSSFIRTFLFFGATWANANIIVAENKKGEVGSFVSFGNVVRKKSRAIKYSFIQFIQ